jgi:hypothetical protein
MRSQNLHLTLRRDSPVVITLRMKLMVGFKKRVIRTKWMPLEMEFSMLLRYSQAIAALDSDFDCIPNCVEVQNETDPNKADTDA